MGSDRELSVTENNNDVIVSDNTAIAMLSMRNSFPLNTAVLPAIIKIHSNKSTFYKFSDVRISLKKKKKTFDISAHGAQNLYETNLTGPSGNLNRSEKKIGITAAQCFFALPQCSLMGLIISYYSNTG